MTTIDKEAVNEAYEDVRNDSSETVWCVLTYDESGKHIQLSASGVDYEQFLEQFSDDQRVYAYVRVVSGDEMSKRYKFVFLAWIGPDVGALKKAKVGVDKGVVKTVVKNFAIEIHTDEKSELAYEYILEQAKKAGGANYGTGSR